MEWISKSAIAIFHLLGGEEIKPRQHGVQIRCSRPTTMSDNLHSATTTPDSSGRHIFQRHMSAARKRRNRDVWQKEPRALGETTRIAPRDGVALAWHHVVIPASTKGRKSRARDADEQCSSTNASGRSPFALPLNRLLKNSGVIPGSFSDEESTFHKLLISHNSRFLPPLGMTPEMMAAADFQQSVKGSAMANRTLGSCRSLETP